MDNSCLEGSIFCIGNCYEKKNDKATFNARSFESDSYFTINDAIDWHELAHYYFI